MSSPITVSAIISADLVTTWNHWNNPESIQGWAFAAEDWECPHAQNDLRVGGRFLTRMAARDGSASFDFTGTYTKVIPHEKIVYTMDTSDESPLVRTCEVTFTDNGDNTTRVTETFTPEEINPIEMQASGWQAILDNFKKFVESK